MEKSNNINKSIEQAHFKDDGSSSVLSDTDEDPSLRLFLSFREKLCKLFESHKFQVYLFLFIITYFKFFLPFLIYPIYDR